ncbi:hypothetical protein [Sphingomonas parva]|uniref:hypothetical protein n=1 Tax=Sphingomonas parva TaxID=2555898 RepID=UPI0014319A1D|nr:hypothetical protein [Sphingomonas parva]
MKGTADQPLEVARSLVDRGRSVPAPIVRALLRRLDEFQRRRPACNGDQGLG